MTGKDNNSSINSEEKANEAGQTSKNTNAKQAQPQIPNQAGSASGNTNAKEVQPQMPGQTGSEVQKKSESQDKDDDVKSPKFLKIPKPINNNYL